MWCIVLKSLILCAVVIASTSRGSTIADFIVFVNRWLTNILCGATMYVVNKQLTHLKQKECKGGLNKGNVTN